MEEGLRLGLDEARVSRPFPRTARNFSFVSQSCEDAGLIIFDDTHPTAQNRGGRLRDGCACAFWAAASPQNEARRRATDAHRHERRA